MIGVISRGNLHTSTYRRQVSLAGTQIWWTTEVNISFGRLEEGYENALKDYNKNR